MLLKDMFNGYPHIRAESPIPGVCQCECPQDSEQDMLQSPFPHDWLDTGISQKIIQPPENIRTVPHLRLRFEIHERALDSLGCQIDTFQHGEPLIYILHRGGRGAYPTMPTRSPPRRIRHN